MLHVGSRLQNSIRQAGFQEQLLDKEFPPVMGHGLNLWMQYRMENKVLDTRTSGRGNDGLADRHLVRADVWSHVVDCPGPFHSPGHAGLVSQLANDHIIDAKAFERGHLVRPVYESSDSRSALRKRLNDRPARLAGCAGDKDHRGKRPGSCFRNFPAWRASCLL